MAAVPNGVFWIGQDGNVYVKGGDGVNMAGRADANTNNYWGGRGFGLIDDPNPITPTGGGSTESGGSRAPSGGGGSGGTVYKDTAAQRAAAQAALDSLGTVQANRLAQEDQQYNNLLQQYAEERAREQGKFNEQTQQNEISLDKQNQAGMLAAAQGGRGLRATLAAMGALGGTGAVLADRAITDSANKDLGGARDNFETNAKTLQTAWGDYEDLDKRRQREAADIRNANRQAVEADILTTRQKLLQDMASYWEQAGNTGAYNNTMAQATSLTPQIAGASRPTAQAYRAQAGSFSPGELSSYLAGNRDMTVGRQAGGAGANPALNNPLYAFSQKREKELV